MKKIEKKEKTLKFSSFLLGVGLTTLIFVGLIFVVINAADEYFYDANEKDIVFASCVIEQFDVKDKITTDCVQYVRKFYPEFIPSGGTIINGTERYSLPFLYPSEFYFILNLILTLGIIFGFSALIARAMLLKVKNC